MGRESAQEPKDQETGKLVLCATPIGNLEDITLRALTMLRLADVVYAEDTRVTAKLLSAFKITKRLERLDEETLSYQLSRILDRVRLGQTVVYCSDAGMPGVSDPGLRLVRAAQDARLTVEVLPGASASSTAYVASGFTHPRYYFGAFFPRKNCERHKVLDSLRDLDATLVFYESPRRLVESLSVIAEVFPHREVAICRELTKFYEEIFRAPAKQVLDEFSRRVERAQIRGEIVLVIEAPTTEELAEGQEDLEEAAEKRAKDMIDQGAMTHKEIIACLQTEYGLARNKAYKLVLSLSARKD